MLGSHALGVAVHLVYRWKTKGWTRARGGWAEGERTESPTSQAPANRSRPGLQ